VIVWPYFGIMVAQIIAMKAWPTTFEYFLYLPIALVWSITFYCIKGTQDPKDLEEEGSDDDEEEKKIQKTVHSLKDTCYPVTGLS